MDCCGSSSQSETPSTMAPRAGVIWEMVIVMQPSCHAEPPRREMGSAFCVAEQHLGRRLQHTIDCTPPIVPDRFGIRGEYHHGRIGFEQGPRAVGREGKIAPAVFEPENGMNPCECRHRSG